MSAASRRVASHRRACPFEHFRVARHGEKFKLNYSAIKNTPRPSSPSDPRRPIAPVSGQSCMQSCVWTQTTEQLQRSASFRCACAHDGDDVCPAGPGVSDFNVQHDDVDDDEKKQHGKVVMCTFNATTPTLSLSHCWLLDFCSIRQRRRLMSSRHRMRVVDFCKYAAERFYVCSPHTVKQ